MADELHPETSGFEPFDAAFQELFAAPHGHRLLKFAVRHVGKTVLISIDGHQLLGTAVVRRDFVVQDGPMPEIERPVLAKALSKDPAKRFPNSMAFVAALYKARSSARIVEVRPQTLAGGRDKKSKTLALNRPWLIREK